MPPDPDSGCRRRRSVVCGKESNRALTMLVLRRYGATWSNPQILTLINGDRIPLTNSMSLLFEVSKIQGTGARRETGHGKVTGRCGDGLNKCKRFQPHGYCGCQLHGRNHGVSCNNHGYDDVHEPKALFSTCSRLDEVGVCSLFAVLRCIRALPPLFSAKPHAGLPYKG